MAGPCADIKDRMRRVLGIPPGQGDILEVAAQRHPSIFWMDSREKENVRTSVRGRVALVLGTWLAAGERSGRRASRGRGHP